MDKEETEEEEFFDANDHFVKDVEPIEEKVGDNEPKELKPQKLGTDGWFGFKGVLNRFSRQKTEEENRIRQIVISIKDETKRELQSEEKLNKKLVTGTGPLFKDQIHERTTNLQIFSDEKTAQNKTNRVEVTVINEDNVQIVSDDIEMSPLDSIKFLLNLIAALILDLFLISSVCHWIYNHLGGLDWYLSEDTFFNFHIFFMTLGICGFGFGILVHRIFRGWSSGALGFLHTTITLMTLIFFVIGVYAVIVSLNHLNSVHFYSVHSWLGLFSMVSFILLWLSAIVIFVFPRFVYDIRRLLIPVHSFFGRSVFTLVCGTAVVGFSDKLRITDEDIAEGPIEIRAFHTFNNDSDDSDLNESSTAYERKIDHKWQMPEEALLLVIISMAFLVYTLLVNYLSANDTFRRRRLPEEQGIDIKTQIKTTLK